MVFVHPTQPNKNKKQNNKAKAPVSIRCMNELKIYIWASSHANHGTSIRKKKQKLMKPAQKRIVYNPVHVSRNPIHIPQNETDP